LVLAPSVSTFDGDQDIVVANGHVSYQSPHAPYRQVPLAFENKSNGRFERVELKTGYFATAHTGRGLACGDLDNNGSADLVFVNLEDPVAVLQAEAPAGRKWSEVRLVGTTSNRSGIGAKVVFSHSGQSETRFVIGGGSYLSHCDLGLLFHWGSDEAAAPTITVSWPSGVQESFAIHPNSETMVREGTGTTSALSHR
jgi:enediyne biosynthesis protein E4